MKKKMILFGRKLLKRRKEALLRYQTGTREQLEAMAEETIQKELKLLKTGGILLIVCLLLAIFTSIFAERIAEIERNPAGGGESSQKIKLTYRGEEAEYDLPISERLYTEEEMEQAFLEGFSYLEEMLCNGNPSLDEIRKPVSFLWEIPDSPLQVQWEFEDESLIDMEGNVYNEDMKKGSKKTHAKVTLTYLEETRAKVYTLTVRPPKRTEVEEAIWQTWKHLQKVEEGSRTSAILKIPSAWNRVKIHTGKKANTWLILFVFLLVILLLLGARQWEAGKQWEKEIKKEAQLEYSNILWQFLLLLEAGLTMKSAWEKIVTDYQRRKADMPAAKQYVYEQMKVIYQKMELGTSQEQAFEEFGKQMSMKCYSKLMTLFLQNLTKGSKHMLQILKVEEQEAFVERCEQAKRLGEEADTKLLLPMGMMLLNILLLLMVPAFMQF